jgi:hypothetical protein
MSNLENKDNVPDLQELDPDEFNNEEMKNIVVEEKKESKENRENIEEKKLPNDEDNDDLLQLANIDEIDNYQNIVHMDRQFVPDAEPGECPFGDSCPIKIAIDNNISPNSVRYDPDIRCHIDVYHRHLNFLFSRAYSEIQENLNMVHQLLGHYDIMHGNQGHMSPGKDGEYTNSKCGNCDNYYDHEDHSTFFMSCCDKTHCLKCIRELIEKDEKCPSCKSNLEYLKDVKFPEKKIVTKDDDDCFICCDTMNTTQYNGKVTLDCKCKFEMCITCAYKTLQDTKHTKMEAVQGIEGLILPQKYTVKGACPNCRDIPKNKEDLIGLYGFLPPRH